MSSRCFGFFLPDLKGLYGNRCPPLVVGHFCGHRAGVAVRRFCRAQKAGRARPRRRPGDKRTLKNGEMFEGAASNLLSGILGRYVDVQRDKLAQPYTSHGRNITEDVVRVTWTAKTADDMLQSTHYDEFVLVATAPEQAGTVYWPVRQVCAEGRNDWVDVPQAGQKLELARPSIRAATASEKQTENPT